MKEVKPALIAAALGLCSCFLSQLPAQELTINAQLKVQQQAESTYANGVWSDKVQTLRVTSVELLSFLASAYSTNFPAGFPLGTKLVLVNYDYFQVQAVDSSILITNVSDFLTYSDSYNENDFLFRGTENTINGVQNYSYYFNATIEFDDHAATNGISFTFTGNSMERYSQTAVDPNTGYRRFQDSFILTGAGQGHVGDSFFLLSGKISAPAVRWLGN